MLRLIRLSSRLAQPVRMRKSSTLTHKYQTMLEKDSDELVQRKLRFMNLSLEHTEQQHNIFIAKYNQRKPQLINSGIMSGAVTVSAYFIHSGLGHHDEGLVPFLALAGMIIGGSSVCGSIFAHTHLLSAHTAFNTYMQHKRGLNVFTLHDDKLDSLLDQFVHYID